MIYIYPCIRIAYISFLFFSFLFFFFLPLRLLSLFVSKKEKKKDHQWLTTAAEATPEADFTLRRERCISSSWFQVLYTIRETSLIMNYRNDPWKYTRYMHFRYKMWSGNSFLLPESPGIFKNKSIFLETLFLLCSKRWYIFNGLKDGLIIQS